MADQAEQDGPPPAGGGNPRSSAAARLAAKRAAKAAAKASKKGTAPIVPSGVADGVSKAGSLYGEHSRVLWASVLAIGVVVVATLAFIAHTSKTSAEAADLLAAGVKTAQAPVVAEGEEAPEEVVETYATERDRAQKALDEYRAVLAKFPDSDAASFARLGEATTLLQLNDHAKAEAVLRKALQRGQASEDRFLQWRALEGIGFALEGQEKYAEAAKSFEKLTALGEGDLRVPGDYHRARMLQAQGKKEEAATLLEAMIKSERERPPEEGGARFESVLADAESLLNSLLTELGKPKLEPKLPTSPTVTPGGPPGQGLSPELMEALRKQLEAAGVQGGGEQAPTGAEGAAGPTPQATPPEGEDSKVGAGTKAGADNEDL